jgi:hypothetical protein
MTNPKHNESVTYVIVLRPLRSHLPVVNRLKGLLKVALRAFRMQCVSCKPIDPKEQ